MEDFLNRYCALSPPFESMLRARPFKIFFRQHRHIATIRCDAPFWSLTALSGHDQDIAKLSQISRRGQRLPAAWIVSNTRTDRYLTETQFDGSGLAPVLQGEARWISDSRIKLPSSLGGAAASAR